MGEHARGGNADVVALFGLWLDIDYGVEGHQKKNLPPTQAHAEALVAEMGLTPTILAVHLPAVSKPTTYSASPTSSKVPKT